MRKALIILLGCIIIFISTNCSYEDINRIMFTTAIIIDVEEEGDTIVYLEVFHAFRSNQTNSEKGERILYKTEGRTIRECFISLAQSSSQKIDFSQNKVILFTERVAEVGISEYLDFLVRDQEFILRPYVAILRGDPIEFIELPIKQNEYIGLFLFDIFDRPLAFLTPRHLQIYQLINQREMGKNVTYITSVRSDKNPLQDKISKDEVAILENDKLVTFIEAEEKRGMAFMLNSANKGMLNVPHPQIEGNFVVVEILSSKTKTNVYFDGESIQLKKSINTRITLDAAQGGIILDEEIINYIQRETEKNITNKCHMVFNKFKELEVDALQVQEVFKRRYPTADVENAITITNLEVETTVFLEGSSGLTDFNTQHMQKGSHNIR
ncbi:Ger(x)C family spore germination protein [Alkaliphilus peptidifermentans]|uniref:Germination protein, Ger(X)C family n=1 Tax=Alkaliphilus peptidifermentans DSM 18978 TaxID=1120976 RepID=A0A1G5CWR9_9FIRM|nr:Ger(x)C family spore germination protein [Alkaliphilus peptidifermentans]SCY06688.1 germination protein, Ger(x)C family [Alkaliphilus peptidifermentans DSM 18978]